MEQKVELWQRLKAGETLSDIGRALGKHAGSIFGVLVAKGGISSAARIRPGRLARHRRAEGGRTRHGGRRLVPPAGA